MQKNLIEVEDKEFDNDEIDMYKLINIFSKNIKLFVIVTIIGFIITCIYIGVRIVFFKNNFICFIRIDIRSYILNSFSS